MRTNVKKESVRTHEGAKAKRVNPEMALRRSVMACMLWEDTFYEEGREIGERIRELVGKVKGGVARGVAIEAREKMKLRHAPLWVVRAMAEGPAGHREMVAGALERVIQRPDELTEFVSLYWKEGKSPLSAQVKKGLARAFRKFDEYQLAKYDGESTVSLRDVLFLCHAKPKDVEQDAIWKKLIEEKLVVPDTWEVGLTEAPIMAVAEMEGMTMEEARVHLGRMDRETRREFLGSAEFVGRVKWIRVKMWMRLLEENKLGALALLRNLRNMEEDGVPKQVIRDGLELMRTERVLPFRFISAARYAPRFEEELEKALFRCLEGVEKLEGRTGLLVDVSGSMDSGKLSEKSEVRLIDAACGLAMVAREMCEDIEVYTFSVDFVMVPSRRGFALRDAIVGSQDHGGTRLGMAVQEVDRKGFDRMIVITDEQSHDDVPDPKTKGYMVNVSVYQNGVGYGAWTHVDGFSERVLDYIREVEKQD
jgi:hypothetical protein